jgi:hypothetical protein
LTPTLALHGVTSRVERYVLGDGPHERAECSGDRGDDHVAVFAARRWEAPRTPCPLGVLIAAAFGLDLIWLILLLTGLERVVIDPGNTAFAGFDFEWYPWSHSVLTAMGWSVVSGALALWVFKRGRLALAVGCLVFSHWVLDFVTHRPDLPVWPGGVRVGLGLWHSIAGTIVVEGALLACSLAVYLRMTRARDAVGRWALVSMVGLVVIVWLLGPWSPPPPNTAALAVVTLALWLLSLWSHWIDRHRPVGPAM